MGTKEVKEAEEVEDVKDQRADLGPCFVGCGFSRDIPQVAILGFSP